tara:strand:- start:825 stop:1490 length:666 start_codon:yes stop_codon:yes gene_type:complete
MASEVKTNNISPATGTAVTVSGLNVGSDAQGDILYHDGTDYTRLAAGTDGHFLKTQGTSANPAWAAAGGDNTPSFGAYRNTNFGYTDDTWTLIPMDTEEFDTDSAFDNSAYKFTVPTDKAGKYCFSVTTTMTDTTSSGQMMGSIKLAIYKGASGGSSSLFKQSDFDGAGARHQYRCLTLTAVLDLIVGDFIEFYGSGESDVANAVSLGGQSYTFCSGFKLL